MSFEALGEAHKSKVNECEISVESTDHCDRLTVVA